MTRATLELAVGDASLVSAAERADMLAELAELRRKAGILGRLLYLCEPGIRPAGLGGGEKALILSLIAWIEGSEGR